MNLANIFKDNKLIFDDFFDTEVVDINTIPKLDLNYVFDNDTLNEVLCFLKYPLNDGLYLQGPSGCGKTTLILQIAARLNYPVQQITLSNKSDISELVGRLTLENGEVCYAEGALSLAMKQGAILILNEIDLLNSSELAALNDVIEGRPLTYLGKDFHIQKPHKQFRIVATANTKGNGDEIGFYSGTKILNQAFLDRWRFIDINYLSKTQERKVLKKACPQLPKEYLNALLALACDLRLLNEVKDTDNTEISAPFTTRAVLRIAKIFIYTQCLSMQRAIELGFANRLNKIEKEYVLRLANDIFGSVLIKQSFKEALEGLN